MNLFKMKSIKVIALLCSMVLVFNACKKDTELVPAPTITTSGVLAGTPGSKVIISASINAPGGIKQVNVLKNGALFDAITGTGQIDLAYSKEYTIENLTAGSIVNFTIQAVDNSNQTSILTTVPVTVTAIPPKTIVTIPAGSLAAGNITWTADKIYKLVGFVRVGEETVKGTITKKTDRKSVV